MLSQPGADDPSGRFIAPEGTGTTARLDGVFWTAVPSSTPPLFTIDVAAWTTALLPTLVPP